MMALLKKYVFIVFAYLLVSGNLVNAHESELLKSADVTKIMQQILKQHVDEKEMSTKIIQHGLRLYVDQFDPFRIYLLAVEAAPYMTPSSAELNQDLQEYANGSFDEFKTLNSTMQKAIVRARQIREKLERNPEELFRATVDPSYVTNFTQDPNLKLAFPKTQAELEQRIKNNIVSFINEEKNKFGAEKINRNRNKTLAIYNRYFESLENGYLFTNPAGQALSAAQQENLFTLHVLKALAGSLDAHTTFYNNQEAYDVKVHLEKEFDGIGIVLEQGTDGSVLIKKTIEGGPAAKSGQINENDQIVSIDGKSLDKNSLQDVMELLRGKNNTPVELVVKRKNDQKEATLLTVKLVRAPITLNEDRAKYSYENFGNGIIGKITLNAFYQGENGVSSYNDVKNAIKSLREKGNLKGLVLDFRDNGGGFLNQAIQVAGLFISNGVVVISKYSDGNEHIYRDMDNNQAYRGPLIILTSKATASAAEIVAQALQDYGVALVVGDERTYGKGTIQSQTVTDDSATTFFKVTIGKYYTVSGKTPQINGVAADVVVPGRLSEENIGEKYLEYALPADQIAPEYKDDLKDIDPGLKEWYLRYYYSTLQPKVDTWRTMLPTLKRNSQYRIENNKNYQAFIKQLKGIKDEKADEHDEEEAAVNEKSHKDFGVNDLQLSETVNILKDMILLHGNEAKTPVAADTAN